MVATGKNDPLPLTTLHVTAAPATGMPTESVTFTTMDGTLSTEIDAGTLIGTSRAGGPATTGGVGLPGFEASEQAATPHRIATRPRRVLEPAVLVRAK
jgi:hypothetical protein